MGYRAHTVTQHRDYGTTVFNDYGQFKQYVDKLRDLYPDDELFMSESEDYFEIDKVIINNEIERLNKLNKDDEFEYKSSFGETDGNGYIISNLQDALNESPQDSSYVTLEWF